MELQGLAISFRCRVATALRRNFTLLKALERAADRVSTFHFASELKSSAAKRNSVLVYGAIKVTQSGATGLESLFHG